MVRSAYLRVYLPITAFTDSERRRLLRDEDDPSAADAGASRSWLVKGTLPGGGILEGPSEGAFVKKVDGEILVCPWRTRLRMLAGLLAFRGSVPEEVAEAFVPDDQARRAAHELASLSEDHPEIRSHIIHANWHVPLRWFAAFDGLDRILVEDTDGLRIRYETTMAQARDRLARAISILEETQMEGEITDAVKELSDWVEEFESDGLLELDYGSVARTFTDEDLLEDLSAAQVWSCLEALERGDVVVAGSLFEDLSERWTKVRATEVVN